MERTIDETFYPTSVSEWRKWLTENHQTKSSIWLIQYKKSTQIPSLTWSEAVDEALCFGWIDGTSKKHEEGAFVQYFTKRKKTSVWSKVNKTKIASLLAENKMMPEGLKSVEIAKQNGSWNILDEVEELIIPVDLEKAFDNFPEARNYFLSLSKSVRKAMLQWIVMAKRPETRQNRIDEVAKCASENKKPKQF